MRTFLLLLTALSFLAIPLASAFAQETKPADQAALEAEFKAALSNATFVGRWAGIKEGELTPERSERYSIVSAEKSGTGDNWIINAKMKYEQQEIIAPIPVQVKWAGDTAVIIVDKLTIPGGGTYDARVLVHKGTYAGTWTGGQRGGLLSGIIQSAAK
jgi:hypothetical protein